MSDPFVRALDLNAQQVPNYELPELGFFEGMGIGADEVSSSLSFNIAKDIALPYSDSEPLDEDQWQASPFFREGLRYTPGMNWDWAQSMANTYDRNIEFSQLHERMTFSGEVGSFIGGMGHGLIDPVNWLALPAGIGVAMARQTGSRVLGAAMYGAMTNAAVETAIAPARLVQSNRLQTEYGLREYAFDVGVSSALGGVLGGLGGSLSALRARKPKDAPKLDEQPSTGEFDAGTAEPQSTPRTEVDGVPFENLEETLSQNTTTIMDDIRNKHKAAC